MDPAVSRYLAGLAFRIVALEPSVGERIFDGRGRRTNRLVGSLRNLVRRSAFHVRRDKAALFFPVGASPTRRPLQPEATGAGMEETKCLKPSDSGYDIR